MLNLRILTHLLIGGVWLVAGACPHCTAQNPFAPPPAPTTAESSVRGIYDPGEDMSSPAQSPPPLPTQDASPASIPISAPISGPRAPVATNTDGGNFQAMQGAQIVARIDGEVVLASDVLWIVNLILESNRDRIPPDDLEEARTLFLRQQVMGLIDTKVLYAAFKRKVPAENLPQIHKSLEEHFEESEIPRLSKMLEVENKQQLVRRLDQLGASLADVQRQFFERQIAGEWMRQIAPKPQPVTHEEMLSYYNEHKSEYEFDAQVRWEEMMVSIQRCGGDRAAAWKAITEMGNAVWQKVLHNPQIRGAVFAEIAKQKSHGFTADKGGLHEWTTKGALRSKEIDAALFALEEGQLSPVIETETGFHIVRVLERKEAGCTPFTEAQVEIREMLTEKARRESGQKELEKLRNQSRIWTVFDGEFRGSQIAQLNAGTARR